MRLVLGFTAIVGVAVALTGCSSYKADASLMNAMSAGEFGVAREKSIQSMPKRARDKSYLLGQQKLIHSSMADGVLRSVEPEIDTMYDLLRTQGANKGKGIASFFTTESGATIWKGEPFEQAIMYSYIAAFDGLQGDWGNVRASAANSIFLIRDFSKLLENKASELNKDDQDGSSAQEFPSQLEEREAIIRALDDQGKDSESDEEGLDLVESDFEIGYLLQAVASDQLYGVSAANEHLVKLQHISSRFNSMAQTIRNGKYNTVVLVSYGLGPEKYGDGMDKVIEMYRPRTESGFQKLFVTTKGIRSSFPVGTDINRLAQDTRWTNMEGLRRAKSVMGTAAVGAGAAVMAYSDSADEALAGAAIMVIGAIMKASSAADVRHCEIIPQRLYLVLLDIPAGKHQRVEFEIDGIPSTKIIIPFVSGPESKGDRAAFHYLRLSEGSQTWRTNPQVRYAFDGAAMSESTLPWIMGGRCLRTPNARLMDEYYKAGLPRDILLQDLIDIYHDEGIVIADLDLGMSIGRHIAEGGTALYTPTLSSTGFTRIFFQDHSPYIPRSSRLKELVERIKTGELAVVSTHAGRDN